MSNLAANQCPICGDRDARVQDHPTRDAYQVECVYCGQFIMSRSLVVNRSRAEKDAIEIAKLSYATRTAHEAGNVLSLNTDNAGTILERPLPRPREQADLLLRWIAEHSTGKTETVAVQYWTHGAIVGAQSAPRFDMLVQYLIKSGLVVGIAEPFLSGALAANVGLSFEGWDRYETLLRGGQTYRRAFMAMKFGDAVLDKLFNETFKQAAKIAGFDLYKLDERPKAGLIDDRLRVEIRSSDFLVADLTHDNAGAYWEAGYAEGLGKPVIYTCEVQKFNERKTHFDTNHHHTILWDASNPDDAGKQLMATIRATLPHLARLQ